MDDAEREELDFAVREYVVVTHYLMDVMSKHESIPTRIARPLMELADAIDEEWSDSAV